MSFVSNLTNRFGAAGGGVVPPLVALPDIGGAISFGGSGNAYTYTPTVPALALADGLVIAGRPGRANTDEATLNYGGLGAKPIVKASAAGLVGLDGGEINAAGIDAFRYLTGSGGMWLLARPWELDGKLALAGGNLTGLLGLWNRTRAQTLAIVSPVAGQSVWCTDLGGGAGELKYNGAQWCRQTDGFDYYSGTSSVTLAYLASARIRRFTGAISGNRTVTLDWTGAPKGEKFRVINASGTAYSWDLGGLKSIPNGYVAEVTWDGASAATVTAYGAL